jgi:hypothetical protein
VDISKGEAVEGDLSAYIMKADAKRRKQEGERPKEESYMPNLRRRDNDRQQSLAWEWLRHHTQKMRNRDTTKALLDAHDRQEIARYERILGIDYEGDDAA